MNEQQRLWILQQMGISVWQERKTANPAHTNENQKSFVVNPPSTMSSVNLLNWDELRQRISACTLCDLHKTRTQTVFGVGNTKADLLIVGEAPGANEDLQGEPFVGRAGKLLDAMLKAIGLDRTQIFIANILKCRPPNNRDPKPEEVSCCTPFLKRQMELLNPKLILALGRIAAHFLLNSNVSLSRLRGTLHHYGDQNIPLLVSYHPAYLLRSPREKRKAYEDLLKVKKMLLDR